MNKLLNSFTSFTRSERVGLLVLAFLLAILLIVRTTMSLWVHPIQDKAKEEQLVKAWERYKKEHSAGEGEIVPSYPDSLDLNTADSEALVSLKGIGPVTAHNIINRRKEKGPFTNFDQLRETGSFPEAVFTALKTKLFIDTSRITRN